MNRAFAGLPVPVRYVIDGDAGAGAVTSITTSLCDGTGAVAAEAFLGIDLRSPLDSGQYLYMWKTERSWAGSCRAFTVTLADGTSHTATFTFR